MKLKELEGVLYSNHGYLQTAIVYDVSQDLDIVDGCSIDYAVKEYAERECVRITAEDNNIVLHIR